MRRLVLFAIYIAAFLGGCVLGSTVDGCTMRPPPQDPTPPKWDGGTW